MAEFIEGKRPIIEALRENVPLMRILMADNLKRDPLVQDVLRKAKQRNVPVEKVPRQKLDDISQRGVHQGFIAYTEPFTYVGVGDVIARAVRANKDDSSNHDAQLVVVLDHITDAGNLGAIIRSAECVGAAGVIIPNKRSARVDATTYKTSVGAVGHLPIALTANITQALKRLQENGFWTVAATEHASEELWSVNLHGNIALVLGNEAQGVSRLVRDVCDLEGRLPMRGKVSSLNVAQASTACMFEWVRQNFS